MATTSDQIKSRFARFESYDLYNTAIANHNVDEGTICFVKNGESTTIYVDGVAYPNLQALNKLAGINYTLDKDGYIMKWQNGSWTTESGFVSNVISTSDPIVNAWKANSECFCIQWKDSDTAKVPEIIDAASKSNAISAFRTRIESAAPCEIKKSDIIVDESGTYPTYSINESDIKYLNKSDLSLRIDGSTSHNSISGTYSEGDEWYKYLQMVKIQNLWVGFAQSGETGNGVYQVWFSTSSTCPTGMSSWFMNAQKITQVDPSTGVTIPDTNKEVVSTVGYKLFNRYQTETRGSVAGSTEYLVNSISASSISATTIEVESCAGLTHKLGEWSAYRLYNANKATHLYEITYWEYIIMCYVFAAYFGTFNIESQYGGITTGYDTAARNHVNGSVTINASTGMSAKNTANTAAYAFMWIENALHGKQYIWTAGCSNRQGIIDGYMDASYGALNSSSGASWKKMRSYVTFSANKANSYVHSSTIYDNTFNFTGLVANSGWNGTVTSIDLFAFPQRYGAGGVRVSAASSGFYDEVYTNATDNTVMYVGGTSNYGSTNGLFYRAFDATADYATCSLRGFATLDVKSGS